MEVSEVLRHKSEMEASILKAVIASVSKFTLATGEAPESIDIGMAEMRRVSRKKSEYVVTEVRTSVTLGKGVWA